MNSRHAAYTRQNASITLVDAAAAVEKAPHCIVAKERARGEKKGHDALPLDKKIATECWHGAGPKQTSSN